MKLTELLCLFLSGLFLVTAVGCGSNEDNVEDTKNGTSAATEEGSEVVDRAHTPDGLPDDLDFKNREFRTLVQSTYKSDMWVESYDSSDIVSAAVYTRNEVVHDRLNVDIVEATDMDYNAISSTVNTLVKGGTYDYDLIMQHMIQAGNDALGDNFLDWYSLPYVDFSREWYPSFAIDGLTVNGKMLIAVGDMLLATIDRTYCIFYDKKHATDLGVDDVADVALNYEWTVDKMTEYSSTAYQDLNGDAKVNVGDYFGFANDCVNCYSVYYYCFDIGRVSIDEDYNVVLHYNDDNGKVTDAIDKLKKLMIRDGTYCWRGSGDKDPVEMFMDEKVLFVGGIIGEALSTVRTYENDYGIIPYPMYDTNQKNYYTIMGGGVSTMEVPRYVAEDEDREFIGAVVEAMCAETWRNVIPQYYDVALKYKGARDEKSVQLMDIMLDSRAVDVAIAYDGWQGFTYKLQDYIHSNKNWTSQYTKQSKAIAKHYQKVADLYAKMDD